MNKIILNILLLLLIRPSTCWCLAAFPGAEGMGADSVGGRGGSVYVVSNLNNSGTGSFRDAVTAVGARYVVFTVSGVIDLTSDLTISNPNLTILGQTSPGGICITGGKVSIETHDVIIRHMRFRVGAIRGDPDYVRALEINGSQVAGGPGYTNIPAYNIVIDHCSISWGIDGTCEVHNNAVDVTFSWCMIGGGLMSAGHYEGNNHSVGFFLWGRYANPSTSVSLHHSFVGYSYFRVPENNYNSFLDSVNNVYYYWNAAYTHQVERVSDSYNAYANIIGTYRKMNSGVSSSYTRSAFVLNYANYQTASIYMTGCLDGSRTSQAQSQWSAQEYWMDSLLSTNWQQLTPWATTGYSGTGIPVTATVMNSSYASSIVASAGATKCQSGNCRDGVDTAWASNYEAGTGAYTTGVEVDTLAEVQSLVSLSSPSTLADTDSDGMADAWETSTFGDLSQTATGDYDSDGYENIEEYSFYLAGDPSSSTPTASGLVSSGVTFGVSP